jgi:hypothetical protein
MIAKLDTTATARKASHLAIPAFHAFHAFHAFLVLDILVLLCTVALNRFRLTS